MLKYWKNEKDKTEKLKILALLADGHDCGEDDDGDDGDEARYNSELESNMLKEKLKRKGKKLLKS